MNKSWLLWVILIFASLGRCRAQVCSSLIVPLNVFVKDGLLVRGVSADHLVLKIHGQKAKINSLGLDVTSRRVVLLLDTSGSMAGGSPRAWQLVPELGAYAVNTIPPDASVAVGSIGEVPKIGDFGDRAQAGARALALTRKSIQGRTPLFDSIHLALLKLGQPHFGDVIYLVTDGGDNHSKLTETQILRELAEHGTRIFALLVSNKQPLTEEQQVGPVVMEDLVKQSGGHLMFIPWTSIGPSHRADLLKVAPLIQSDIGTSYRMEVSLTKPIRKVVSLQLRYTGPDQRLARNSTWIYPQRIAPCAAPARP